MMQVAIVTGASSGMGKEFVKLLLTEYGKADHEIWLLARRQECLEAWQQQYPEHRFRLFPLDLSQDSALDSFGQSLEELQGKVSCFIHAAGFGVMGSIAEISIQEQMEMVEVNCKSTVALTKMILPKMQKDGRMIYMASAAAFLPQPGFAVYAASKAFVLSFVRSLRREHKRYRITAVCPGAVKTEFFNRAARLHPLPAYKKLVMAEKQKVVKKAWRDNSKNREISVYGKMMQGFFLITKILPHAWILKFVKSGKAD